MKRDAFTMVELVFVIVILGILAAVAVPRLAASRDDANIAKYKSDVSAIRSSIVTTRSQNLMSGDASYPDLNKTNPTTSKVLFDKVLDYPVRVAGTGESGWSSFSVNGNTTSVTLRLNGSDVKFDYNKTSGIFTCVGLNNSTAKDLCETLVY